MDAEVVERLQTLLIGAGIATAGFQATGEHDGGFQPYHVEILVDGDVVHGFEIEVILLAFAHFHRRLTENIDEVEDGFRVALQFEKLLHGDHREGVAGEDGGVAVPFLIDGGLPAPHVSLVHDVVVDEGEVVQHLESGRDVTGLFRVAIEHFGRDVHHLRAQPLTRLHQDVTNWVIEIFGSLILEDFLKLLFNVIHDFTVFENLQRYVFLSYMVTRLHGYRVRISSMGRSWGSEGTWGTSWKSKQRPRVGVCGCWARKRS